MHPKICYSLLFILLPGGWIKFSGTEYPVFSLTCLSHWHQLKSSDLQLSHYPPASVTPQPVTPLPLEVLVTWIIFNFPLNACGHVLSESIWISMKPLDQNQEPKKVGRCTDEQCLPCAPLFLPLVNSPQPHANTQAPTSAWLGVCPSWIFKKLAKKSQVGIYSIKPWAHTLNH